jgi:peptidoglycan/xylan/chitin deacetylase (PgdA/CDA1 family)
MATLESALAFIGGQYTPRRDLCLLTFDDGLREHAEFVFPMLAEHGIEGQFYVMTSVFEGVVAAPHKNHFLMAYLGADEYSRRAEARLADLAPTRLVVDTARAVSTYRWDKPEVARFKYLVNFELRC